MLLAVYLQLQFHFHCLRHLKALKFSLEILEFCVFALPLTAHSTGCSHFRIAYLLLEQVLAELYQLFQSRIFQSQELVWDPEIY